MWLNYTLGAFGIAAFGTMVDYGLVEYVTESRLKVVASAAVFMGVISCIGIVAAGVSEYGYYRSILRQAEVH
jgi:hypothetical protein